MSFRKELCLICERPTAGGAVLAVQVDNEKLQTWFLNVCGHELAEEIEDDDLICSFCLWHAEFLWKFNGMTDEALVWWNLDLDDAARELRKHYFEGNIEQCWVPLEEVDLPESEKEEIEKDEMELESEMESTYCPEKKRCLYCGKLFDLLRNLSRHVKKTHKEAIRCENHQCPTYFHTIEEREKHNEEVHEKPIEQKILKCDICSKEFKGYYSINQHVRLVHREFPVKCAFMGCVSFFKINIDMRAHFDSLHKNDDTKKAACEYCDYKTRKKSHLEYHVARRHMKKTLKCNKCDEMFSVYSDLSRHMKNMHTIKRCKICALDVVLRYFASHISMCTCVRCKNQFLCSGLYQSHLKKCRESLLKCANCPRSFQRPYLLVYHMKRQHKTREWRGLEHRALGFKCEPCKRYYKSAKILIQHSFRMHNQAKLKHCAHCPKSFLFTTNLKIHLAKKHNLLELEFECDTCKKQFISKHSLYKHIRSIHFKYMKN